MATNEERRASLARIFKSSSTTQQQPESHGDGGFSDLSKMESESTASEILLRPKLLKQSQIETPPQTPKPLMKNGGQQSRLPSNKSTTSFEMANADGKFNDTDSPLATRRRSIFGRLKAFALFSHSEGSSDGNTN